jgi:hypothetical protein
MHVGLRNDWHQKRDQSRFLFARRCLLATTANHNSNENPNNKHGIVFVVDWYPAVRTLLRNGDRPAHLAVQLAPETALTINRGTANALGFTLLSDMEANADIVE